MCRLVPLLGIFLFFHTTAVVGQAFGIPKGPEGLPLLTAGQELPGTPGVFSMFWVPEPNPAFSRYIVRAAPKAGVCGVVGLAVQQPSHIDAFFASLLNQLGDRYDLLRTEVDGSRIYDFDSGGHIRANIAQDRLSVFVMYNFNNFVECQTEMTTAGGQGL